MTEDLRWKQRLQSLGRALHLLREVIYGDDDILKQKPIVKEGTIQRFEFTFELTWKTLKDKMEYDGLALEASSPRYVFKLAAQHQYIEDLDKWLDMTKARNLMSHTYNAEHFDTVLQELCKDYIYMLDELYTRLVEMSLL